MSERSSREGTGIHRMERTGDGPATGRAEQRTSPRYEVSLPVRFTVDGETFHEGVCTSISAGGVFIQAELLPSMKASVWIDLGLAPGEPRLRCSGTVVNLNRRYGAEVIYGFGVRLADRPTDLDARVERLRAACPGPVRLDGLGFLVWPLYGGSDRSLDGQSSPGLVVWSGSRWIDGGPATHVVTPGEKGAVLGRPLDQYLRAARGLGPQVQAVREPLVPFGYYGKCLTPQEGVPREALLAAFAGQTGEVLPWLRALAAQMRLIDDLTSAAWRLENVGAEQLRALAETGQVIAQTRGDVAAIGGIAHDEEAVASAQQAVRGLEALERYVERVSWAARTLVPVGESARAFADWKAARRTQALRLRAKAAAEHVTIAAPGVEVVAVPRRQLVAALALMAVILGAIGVLVVRVQTFQTANSVVPSAVLAKEELHRYIPLEKVVVMGRKVVGIVPEEWVKLPQKEQARGFVALCEVLADRGYVEAELKTASSTDVATWKKGEIHFAERGETP